MDTDGVTEPFTVIVMAELVAVAVVAQLALLVKTQVTAWPLVNEEVVNRDELVPAFDPFTFH
jgi:hypothetical protein